MTSRRDGEENEETLDHRRDKETHQRRREKNTNPRNLDHPAAEQTLALLRNRHGTNAGRAEEKTRRSKGYNGTERKKIVWKVGNEVRRPLANPTAEMSCTNLKH